MRHIPVRRLFTLGAVSVVLGAVLLVIESVFYQSLDANGVLQESWFMPLGMLCLALGALLLLVAMLGKLRAQ